MWVLFHDQRGHLGAMWQDNCPTHVPSHGHLLNVKFPRKPVLNSHFATFITRSSYCRALRALDSITMAIMPTTRAHSASIQLSVFLSVHASCSSFRPMVLGPTQPCLSLPKTFWGGGISSPVLPSDPSLFCTYVPSRVMPRCHHMRCRRDGGCDLPSRPPLSHAMGRELNLLVGWAEPRRLDPVNISAQLSLQLLVSPLASSSIRPKERLCKSTILPKLEFIPCKMKALPVQSTSSGIHYTSSNSGSDDNRSSNNDEVDKNEDKNQLMTTSNYLDMPGSLHPQVTSHTLRKEDED